MCGPDDRLVVLVIADGALKVHSEIEAHDRGSNPPDDGRWIEWSPRIGGSGMLHSDPN